MFFLTVTTKRSLGFLCFHIRQVHKKEQVGRMRERRPLQRQNEDEGERRDREISQSWEEP